MYQCKYFIQMLSHRFSEVFDYVARNSHDDIFYEDDIWPGEDENGYCIYVFLFSSFLEISSNMFVFLCSRLHLCTHCTQDHICIENYWFSK